MIKKLSVLVFFVSIFIFYAPKANALGFQESFLRLNSLKVSAPLSGTVCAKPSSPGSGVENKIIVEFPSEFIISANTNNWDTSTTSLPTDGIAWPSIGNHALSVNTNKVTFSSGDLTTNNLYCFNFLANSSQNSSSTGNNRHGTITTKTSSNTTIDYVTYAVSIVSNNQISVSASVNPKISDLQLNLQKLNSENEVTHSKILNYKITYGSYLTNAYPITIEAKWSQGTIAGNSTPSVDILDYVTGSASNGINGVSPVVDLINRKITWTFNSFPANSLNNNVNFSLRTNFSYTGSSKVNFVVSAKSSTNTTVTPYDNVSQSYIYQLNNNTQSPTKSPTPTPSSTITPIVTPSITPALAPQFSNIETKTISENSSKIFSSTTQRTKMRILYGKSQNKLDNTISFTDFATSKTFELKNLEANTNYYFKIYAINSLGKAINSDIFTFTTAKGEPAVIEQESIIVTSRNNVIYNTVSALQPEDKLKDDKKTTKEQYIVIPQNTNYQLTFAFKEKKSIKGAKIKLTKIVAKAKRVLGISSFFNEAEAASDNVSLLEIKPGVYTATVRSNIEPGIYEIAISYVDNNGNLTEEVIGSLKVTNPFTLLNQNRQPVEGARVFLYIYNLSSKTFIPLSSSDLNIQNPIFSDHFGIANFVLPKGKYKALITDIGYKEITINFEIEDNDLTDYPIVKLESESPSILRISQYYIKGFTEVYLTNTSKYLDSIRYSIRFFDLVAFLALALLVVLTLFAFSHRHGIQIRCFISYFFYLLNHKQRNKKYINGAVFDQYENPVTMANVYLINKDTEQIIKNTKTNNKGEFFFNKSQGQFLLMVMKKGYESTPQLPYTEREDASLKITMEKKDVKSEVVDLIRGFIGNVFGMTFETLSIISVFFEIIFIPSFGIIKTAPFLIISIFSLTLWTLHNRHHKK